MTRQHEIWASLPAQLASKLSCSDTLEDHIRKHQAFLAILQGTPDFELQAVKCAGARFGLQVNSGYRLYMT